MDFLRDPIWQFIGVVVTVILALTPFVYRWLKRRKQRTPVPAKSKVLRILVVQSRPGYLYGKLGKDHQKGKKKIKRPEGIVECKPEVITDVESDSSIIQRIYDEVGKRVLLRSLQEAKKSDLALALRSEWDIVHFDCVVGPEGQLFLADGEISPQALRELLINKNISLLVLMDCDSLKVVSSANSAGVKSLIAVTGSLPVLAAEKFCFGLYKGIATGKSLFDAFVDAKALAAVEMPNTWDSTLFVLDGESKIILNGG